MYTAYAICMMVPITLACLSLLFTALYFIGREHLDIQMYNSLFDEPEERVRLVPDPAPIMACDEWCDYETKYDPTHSWFPKERDVEREYKLVQFLASLTVQKDKYIDYMFDFSDVEVCNA